MSTLDLGESLVGAYLRHVEGCPIVLYNSFLSEQQGEVDVVAVKPAATGSRRVVFLCEVTTHINGMARTTVKRVPGKLARVRQFADLTFPGEDHRFQWWSPYVNEGVTTRMFEGLVQEWSTAGHHLEFVINEDYSSRVAQLIAHARQNKSTTGEPAYRMLQVLTHLRGEALVL